MELNKWQKEMLEEYCLGESDITLLNRGGIETKNYLCSNTKCGQYELLGFIKMCDGYCRDCHKDNAEKVLDKKIEKHEAIILSEAVGYKTLAEMALGLSTGESTIKRWKGKGKIEKRDGLYYLLEE